MVRPKLTAADKAEAAAAREAGFAPRRDILRAVGTALHGATWITPLAADVARVAERPVLRGTVAQWDALHRQIPAWAWDALGLLARDGAAALRRRADDLDAAFPASAPSGPEEPPAQEEEPYDAVADAVADMEEELRQALEARDAVRAVAQDEEEVDAMLTDLGSRPPPPVPAPEPARPTTWTSKASREGYA